MINVVEINEIEDMFLEYFGANHKVWDLIPLIRQKSFIINKNELESNNLYPMHIYVKSGNCPLSDLEMNILEKELVVFLKSRNLEVIRFTYYADLEELIK